MTQKEKSILLKDLCARLPYGVKVQVEYDAEEFGKSIEIDEITMIDKHGEEVLLYHAGEYFNIEEIKPYLRSMSSMTKDEFKDYDALFYIHSDGETYCENWEWMDWMNDHHMDYRGLIPMGLALEAPEEMYNIKKK